MRSGAERVEMLPTERERQADGVSRHRTNNSAASGYLRAVYRLLKVGGVARGPTFSSRQAAVKRVGAHPLGGGRIGI